MTHVDVAECDSWLCLCGNQPFLDGFSPCDSAGHEVEPTDADWREPLWLCSGCLAIIDQRSGQRVGVRARGADS